MTRRPPAACRVQATVGQGLSRLINLTDGLLGRGVRCILLVTTNEPIGRLRPAVRRPGRGWASIELGPFDASEATAWAGASGVERERAARGDAGRAQPTTEDRALEEASGAGFGFGRPITG